MARERRGGDFQVNQSAINGMPALLLSEQSRAAAVAAAKDIKAEAERTSPYDAVRDDREHYVDRFGIKEPAEPFLTFKTKVPHAHAEVFNDARNAAAIEFGNAKTSHDGLHVLRDAGAKFHNPIEEGQ